MSATSRLNEQALYDYQTTAIGLRDTERAIIERLIEEVRDCWAERKGAPIPLILTCPCCGERHIDQGLFATKPHHTHACQHCGVVFKPALVHTVGVQFLPGCKDGE